MVQRLDIGSDNEAAAKFLESYIQSGNLNFLVGSGASSPAIKIAGNIEAEINKLLSEKKDAQANIKSLDFIEAVDRVQALLSDKSPNDAKTVAGHYQSFISIVDHILFARKNILLPRQANIFTTNYDMFFEYAASQIPTVILNDGFDRTASPSGGAHFTPERYFDRTYRSGAMHSHQTEIPTINLIKLHGSVSWRRQKGTVTFDPTSIKALNATEKADKAIVTKYLEQHFLILPNFRKFHDTLMERVYYDLLRLFSKAMDQQNVVLFSFGFSFADEHILDITKRALRNPTSHLIIFSYDHSSADSYAAKFENQRNVTVLRPDAGIKIDLARLSAILGAIVSGQANAA